MGIEPTFEAWEAPVLPLNYTRNIVKRQQFTEEWEQVSPPDGRGMVVVSNRESDSTCHRPLFLLSKKNGHLIGGRFWKNR